MLSFGDTELFFHSCSICHFVSHALLVMLYWISVFSPLPINARWAFFERPCGSYAPISQQFSIWAGTKCTEESSWNLTRRVWYLTKESSLETMIITKVTSNEHYFVMPMTCVPLIHNNNDTFHLGSTFHLNWMIRVNISILLVFHINLCVCHWQMKKLQKCFPHHLSLGTKTKQGKFMLYHKE